MAGRNDILLEMGLAPVWRLRVVRDGDIGIAALEPEHVRAPEPGSRAARIAALEWRDFAVDVDACTACGLHRGRKKRLRAFLLEQLTRQPSC